MPKAHTRENIVQKVNITKTLQENAKNCDFAVNKNILNMLLTFFFFSLHLQAEIL
jgi:hypothetical protein